MQFFLFSCRSLRRCIGTIINSKNILCSVGVVVEQMYMQMVTSWRAIYMVMVEIGMYMLNSFGGTLSQNIVMAFPTDQFYSLVCACKDVYASAVGVAIAVIESMADLITTGRIDLTIHRALSPQESVLSTQIRSLGTLAFNIVADSTLYPLLALHRWIMCVVNAGLSVNPDTLVTVQFGDVAMDSSWGACSPLANDFAVILDPSQARCFLFCLQACLSSVRRQMQYAVQNSVDSFVAYTLALLSGVGDTVLYALLLMYDSTIAFLLGIVWGIQNMIYAFNLSSCKVADYTQKLVLQCACGDRPYFIPPQQRSDKWNTGGLWCSGSLSVTLVDGTQGVIFNPYSLDELSAGLAGVTEYIQCLARSTSPAQCPQPKAEKQLLGALIRQNVDPIAVWVKCKSNYLLQSWDTGAGALFLGSVQSASITTEVYNQRRAAQAWAQGISPLFANCMGAPERFNVDYSSCLIMFLNLTTGRLPNAYFLYTPQTAVMKKEPPDACLVFSGLKNASRDGTPLSKTMQSCMMDELQYQNSDASQCPFNPSIWSASTPNQVPVAKLFGTVAGAAASPTSQLQAQYQSISSQVQSAFDTFNQTFFKSAKEMRIELFTADGDFLHDFFDCVFLGPYTRFDILPCDRDGKLECPFYARDEFGGMTRQFTACYGPVMHGDEKLPFTCGSQARRAIIKYFFRDYCFSSQSLNSQITNLIYARVQELQRNLTNMQSYGCLNATSGRCSPQACTRANGYAPCMDMSWVVSSKDVSQYLLKDMLRSMDSYYDFVMQVILLFLLL